jgi:hypothetical protein
MEPRDEDAENMLAGFIRGPGGDPDVTQWMNNSGEGDPELARRDGSGEGEAYNIGEGDDEGEADGSDEGEADGSGRTLEITNSGEVHIYMLINEASVVYIHVLTLFLLLAIWI